MFYHSPFSYKITKNDEFGGHLGFETIMIKHLYYQCVSGYYQNAFLSTF